jgi:pyridoxine 5-phosphate synthase
MKLGVNIDHVATLRQARYRGYRTVVPHAEPNLLSAAHTVKKAGAHGITIHLREDRRHIQDQDVWTIKRRARLPLNLELSTTPEIIRIALKVQPEDACLVPERREEVTTEGGLDVIKGGKKLQKAIDTLRKKKIIVSLFIAADPKQIRAAAKTGAEFIELHTGSYAEAHTNAQVKKELKRLKEGSELAHSLGLRVNAGHGLRYTNLKPILKIPHLEVLNIGHSIISRSVSVGLETAIREMLRVMRSK